jgi:hypothetical protein
MACSNITLERRWVSGGVCQKLDWIETARLTQQRRLAYGLRAVLLLAHKSRSWLGLWLLQ